MGRKWEPFDVQAELVKIFMDEGVCPWCGGELTEEEARQVEAEYFAKREAASEAEWDRRLAQRVAEGPLGLKHYGVWHPDRSWVTKGSGELIVTTHKAVAEAQRDALLFCLRGLTSIDPSLYEVRCIEEWCEAQGC